MSNTLARIITGSIFAFTILATLLLLPPIYFTLLLLLMLAIILINEWPRLANANKALWLLTPLYPIAPFALLIYMNHLPEGHSLLPLLFITAFSNDTGAYIAGNLFGNHPLLKSVSPKKTWEGFIGGVMLVWLSLAIYGHFTAQSLVASLNTPQIVLLATLISLIATTGDLFESWLKRAAQLKDTGSLLPGHGGLLDRLDSILFLVILFYCIAFHYQV